MQVVFLYDPYGHHLIKTFNSKNIKRNYSKVLRFDTFLGNF